jgi:hypothetical protein
MNSSSRRNDDTSTIATGIKAAALVFALGAIALAADPMATPPRTPSAPDRVGSTLSAAVPAAATVYFPSQYLLDAKEDDTPPAPTF